MEPRSKLSRSDWVNEALAVVAESGMGAVAVEPLAKRLGATKGSFYWHFEQRSSLIEAVLAAWEVGAVDGLVADTGDATAAGQLQRVLSRLTELATREAIEAAVLAAWDHPQVGPVVERVHEQREGYIIELYERLGLSEQLAAAIGHMVYAMYVGHLQLGAQGMGPFDLAAYSAGVQQVFTLNAHRAR